MGIPPPLLRNYMCIRMFRIFLICFSSDYLPKTEVDTIALNLNPPSSGPLILINVPFVPSADLHDETKINFLKKHIFYSDRLFWFIYIDDPHSACFGMNGDLYMVLW